MTPQHTLTPDPTEADICAALGSDGPRADAGEGVHQRRDGEMTLTVAWWTNARGRRWLRVTREAGEWPDFAARPPLWHVAPGRVFRVTRSDGESRWLVACGCGEVGTPESTMWMGDRCGACHDRREEGDLAAEPPTGVHRFGEVVHAVAMGTAGAMYVADDAGVHAVDTVTGGVRTLRATATVTGERVGRLVASPDGRSLVAIHYGQAAIAVIDTATGEAHPLSPPAEQQHHLLQPAFSPDGEELVIANTIDPSRRWSRRASGWVEHAATLPAAQVVAFGPDGLSLLLVKGGDVRIYDRLAGRVDRLPPVTDVRPDVMFAGWAGGDRIAYVGRPDNSRAPNAFVRRTTGKQDIIAASHLAAYLGYAVVAGGDLLCYVADGVLTFHRTTDLSRVGTIDPGRRVRASRTSFAPDADVCAAAVEADGVIMVPWRALPELRP